LMWHEEVQACWCAGSDNHTFVDIQGACFYWCVWSDSTTIVKHLMDNLSPSQMDNLSLSMRTSYLSCDVCFVSKHIWVDCACMSKGKQWEIELTCQLRQAQRRRRFANPCLLCSQRRQKL
jgi:hypothetical protein